MKRGEPQAKQIERRKSLGTRGGDAGTNQSISTLSGKRFIQNFWVKKAGRRGQAQA